MRSDRTIAITEVTKKKLISLKRYPRETMDDIINRLLKQKGLYIEESKEVIVTEETRNKI